MQELNLVAAMCAENRAIGMNNRLPWEDAMPVPNPDMRRFTRLTKGNVVVMGRRTLESLPENFRPLPNRDNVFVTRNPRYKCPGAWGADSLPSALQRAEEIAPSKPVFVIGGAGLFAEAMEVAKRIYLTKVHLDLPGDVFFPDFSAFSSVIEHEVIPADGSMPKFEFLTLERP
jgi:dihydrofolate reductase